MTSEQIDRLYPGPPAVSTGGACPEAALSLCLKGRLRGVDAQLTVRGSTRAEFLSNILGVMDLTKHLEDLSTLFDEKPRPPSGPPPEGWCAVHGVEMHETIGKTGARWYSHRTPDGWCKGRTKGDQHGHV